MLLDLAPVLYRKPGYKMPRVKARIAAWLACLFFAPAALAQTWPTKPVHFIVPFAPAGPVDIIVRLLSPRVSEILGQQLVIENKPGAGGNMGAVQVSKSPPDGYTALITSSAFAVNVSLFANAGYDADRDFAPVIVVASQPNLIAVNSNLPARTLSELLTLARNSKLAYASPGVGTTPHLTAENLFRVTAKLDITPIHFKGAGPAVTATVSGEPPLGAFAISGPLPHIKSGKLRTLAVSSSRRVPALPDVPTFAEAGFPGMEDYTWVGVFLPTGTPAAIVQRLNEAINRAMQAPDVKERLESFAFDLVGGSPQQTAEYVRAEVRKWGKVVRETGAKAE
jgi:tripartite-type tricarboxylate transporter receptor subunit TctC